MASEIWRHDTLKDMIQVDGSLNGQFRSSFHLLLCLLPKTFPSPSPSSERSAAAKCLRGCERHGLRLNDASAKGSRHHHATDDEISPGNQISLQFFFREEGDCIDSEIDIELAH